MTTTPDISACADCLCLASRKASRAVTAHYDRALAPHGLRATQFSLLATLELRGATPLGELAKFLGLDRTTLTRNLQPLEDGHWLRSRPAPEDGRSRILSVTERGREAVFAAFPAWRKAQDEAADVARGHDLALLDHLAEIARRH